MCGLWLLNEQHQKPISNHPINHGRGHISVSSINAHEECHSSISITVPLGAQFAVGDSWLSEQLLEVTTQILAVIFFIGAGNTMNDIKDVAIDRTAHPERPLASELNRD